MINANTIMNFYLKLALRSETLVQQAILFIMINQLPRLNFTWSFTF